MRKLAIIAALLILAIGVVPAHAQAPSPNGPWTSAFTIQNLEANTAACEFVLYDPTGAEKYTGSNISIGANGSYFVYVGNLPISSGQYSGVIKCDRQVAAVSNATGSGSADSYNALGPGDINNVLYAPGLYRSYHGYMSNVVAQNTTGAPIDITLDLFVAGNPSAIKSYKMTGVPANASVTFDQNAETDLPNGLYSGRITGTGAVAAVANLWNSAQLFSYSLVASGGPTAYTPVIMNNYAGFSTALTIQNMGSSPTQVQVTYSNGVNKTITVAGNSPYLLYTPNEGLAAGIYSAKAQSLDGGTIVALVNESAGNNRAGSYTGFKAGSLTANAPIILKGYFNYSTSITCQNVGGAPANITFAYSNGATQTIAGVPVNGSALAYQPNLGSLPNNFNGSAVITSAQPIVCVVNENQVTNTASQDWLLTYRAIQQ